MIEIKIFLACSLDDESIRDKFELELYRHNEEFNVSGIRIKLDHAGTVPKDLKIPGTQVDLNKLACDADIFILIANEKAGDFLIEEFEEALKENIKNKKPKIYTYFTEIDLNQAKPSLIDFKKKIEALGHYYQSFKDFEKLWQIFENEFKKSNHLGDKLSIDDHKIMEVKNIISQERSRPENLKNNFSLQQLSSLESYLKPTINFKLEDISADLNWIKQEKSNHKSKSYRKNFIRAIIYIALATLAMTLLNIEKLNWEENKKSLEYQIDSLIKFNDSLRHVIIKGMKL